MLESEFWELLYYHVVYSMDTGLITVLLIVVIFELFRINKTLTIIQEGKSSEKNKTKKCKANIKSDNQANI